MKLGDQYQLMIDIDLSCLYYLIMAIYLLGINCLTSCMKDSFVPLRTHSAFLVTLVLSK